MKYLIQICWSDEDEAFIAEIPALEGCVSHGSSYEEALKHIQDAAEAWLTVARRHGDPIPSTTEEKAISC